MIIIREYPPNYKEICKVFDIKDRGTIVFTWGDKIYCQDKVGKLPEDIKVHEATHQIQQAGDPKKWWDRYLIDISFRLDQEVEAYRNQYNFFLKFNHNIKDQEKLLDKISGDLSSKTYGNIVTKLEARNLILV